MTLDFDRPKKSRIQTHFRYVWAAIAQTYKMAASNVLQVSTFGDYQFSRSLQSLDTVEL